MGTAGLRYFPLIVMYPEGTLEATPRELLQEILSPGEAGIEAKGSPAKFPFKSDFFAPEAVT